MCQESGKIDRILIPWTHNISRMMTNMGLVHGDLLSIKCCLERNIFWWNIDIIYLLISIHSIPLGYSSKAYWINNRNIKRNVYVRHEINLQDSLTVVLIWPLFFIDILSNRTLAPLLEYNRHNVNLLERKKNILTSDSEVVIAISSHKRQIWREMFLWVSTISVITKKLFPHKYSIALEYFDVFWQNLKYSLLNLEWMIKKERYKSLFLILSWCQLR